MIDIPGRERLDFPLRKMSDFKLTRVPSLKTVEAFRKHVAELNLEIPCDDTIQTGEASSIAQPVPNITINA